MAREVRRVPKDWQHPKNEKGNFIPLFPGKDYKTACDGYCKVTQESGIEVANEDYGGLPDKDGYMPVWMDEEATHYMMYEECSEGTPISPACATPEELAHWLEDNHASAFGNQTASYESWLRVANGGYAPSMIFTPETGLVNGVDALTKKEI